MNEKRRLKRERAELEAEERHQRALQEQIERAQAAAAAAAGAGPAGGEMQRDEYGAPLGFALPVARPEGAGALHGPSRLGPRPAAFDDAGGDERAGPSGRGAGGAAPAKKSKLEELMERDQRAKAAAAARPALGGPPPAAAAAAVPPGREEPWVREGIVVKIMSRALREAGYYKSKGVVVAALEGGYIAEIEVLESGEGLRVHCCTRRGCLAV